MSTLATLCTALSGALELFAVAYAPILILRSAGVSQDVTNGVGLLAVWMSAPRV